MKKFLVTYYSTPEKLAAFTALKEEEKQAGMQAWNMWKDENEDAIIDIGSPLMSPLSVGNLNLTNDSSQILSGFSVIQAENKESAKSIFTNHPHLKNGIQIFESIEM